MLKPVKTLDEFVLKYDKDLERILCKSFKKWFNIDDLEEVKNDVYCHLLDKKFFETYDSNIAQFSTYLYTYLRFFLKSRKGKEDKNIINDAESLSNKVFEEGDSTLLDIKDFNHKNLSPLENMEVKDINKEIEKLMTKKIKNFTVINPFKQNSILNIFWEFMQTSRTLKEIENFVDKNIKHLNKNPYNKKKDEIKYKIFSYFKNKKFSYLTEETNLWINVPGIVKFDHKNYRDQKVLNFIEENPTKKDFLNKYDVKVLNELINFGIVKLKKDTSKRGSPYVIIKNNKPILHFNKTKNLAWYLINTVKDMYPELLIFENNKYTINAKENAAYKIYQMMINGKSNKHILNTYKIKNSVLSSTKRFVLNDIKKMIIE